VKEEFPGLGAFHSPQDDRAAVRLDPLGDGSGRRCGRL